PHNAARTDRQHGRGRGTEDRSTCGITQTEVHGLDSVRPRTWQERNGESLRLLAVIECKVARGRRIIGAGAGSTITRGVVYRNGTSKILGSCNGDGRPTRGAAYGKRSHAELKCGRRRLYDNAKRFDIDGGGMAAAVTACRLGLEPHRPW